jgi:FtsP/CotA-like multicopper oxidase with cupredoxin domain
MTLTTRRIRNSWALPLALAGALAVLGAGGAEAITIEGITGPIFTFSAGAGEVSIADGGSYEFWGYEAPGANPFGLPQLPGPTLIVNQNDVVTVTLTSELPYSTCTSMVFPGHAVTATGGTPGGLLTNESCGPADVVTYTFTATEPGTYMYYSGTQPELQVEMGLFGALIVRPTGYVQGIPSTYTAYGDVRSAYDHEYLFLLSSMDPYVHQLAEQGRFAEIDLTERWPVYWFVNGRTAPDDLANNYVAWLPHQPYNSTPMMNPGQRVLVRIIGADQDQHPLHLHGNHYHEIAHYGRMLETAGGALASRAKFTTLSVPGQTVDAIFTWTGAKLGWDIYGAPSEGGPAHDCIDAFDNVTGLAGTDGYADTFAQGCDPNAGCFPWEWCDDHDKGFPVTLPENQNLAFGGWFSGSPFLGGGEQLPPGEGGLNPNGGFFFMWHSHTEKELTNFDIFPGGMLSMMVVDPPWVPVPVN